MSDCHYEGYAGDLLPCPCCAGWGHVDCHCGGDLCVCTNYGEAMCPFCCGEGDVTETDYNRYEEARREQARLWAAARAEVEAAESKLPQPPEPPCPSTSRRG